MESVTYLKNLDIPPKKLRMFLPKVKKMSPVQAVSVLYYSPNRPAKIFYKAIKSAIANAKQTLKVSDDLLQFKLFTVEEGNKLKRYTAGSRGSAKPFKKRYSHIKIILISRTEQEVAAVKSKKSEVKTLTAPKAETQAAESAVKTSAAKKTVKKPAPGKTKVTKK